MIFIFQLGRALVELVNLSLGFFHLAILFQKTAVADHCGVLNRGFPGFLFGFCFGDSFFDRLPLVSKATKLITAKLLRSASTPSRRTGVRYG